MIWHIIPQNDIIAHEDNSKCVCQPEVEMIEDTGDMMVIHNSFDGREAVEFANEILGCYE